MMDNMEAFLTVIATSEGTAAFGNHGYDCVVGSTMARTILFNDYKDHPRVKVRLSPTLWSTAAGRYQILEHNYDVYKALLNLPDFSPQSQDAIAVKLIKEQRAYDDVMAGRFETAVGKCANIWASFPGANYGQHEQRLTDLRASYGIAGGKLA